MSDGGKFEALNYALRKSKDGVIVSFVVHPSDVDAALTALPIGARVEITWTECSDEEPKEIASVAQPAERHSANVEVVSSNLAGCSTDTPASANGRPSDFDSENSGSSPEAGAKSKPRKRFSEMPLSAQAGMRCAEPMFWAWLSETTCWCENEDQAVAWLYSAVSIDSRRKLDTDAGAAAHWAGIERDFQTWLTDQAHFGTYR